ncbi:MAG: cobalamin-dependent protein, partial [Anaerolineae bacterium]
MKVLLINPQANLPIEVRTSPPLGLAYLGAVSEQRGDEVRILDMEVEETPLNQVLREERPDLVGITANTIQIKAAWRVAQEIKAEMALPIVLGGPHPTVLPEESAQRPGVDIVVGGEGEATWADLCQKLDAGASLEEVEGISYRQNGRVVHNPDRPPITDVDSLPFPAHHLFKMEHYTNLQPTLDTVEGKSLSIITSRGCPYRCTYCSQ